MSRPDRDSTLMLVAYLYQQRSTCDRNQVGAVISIDGRIVATGYNGTPAGMPHCDHSQIEQRTEVYLPGMPSPLPHRQTEIGCKLAVHAEANAISFAAKHGVGINAATIHTTLSPCYACAQLIVNAGIVRVVFSRPYRDASGVDLLNAAGVVVDAVIDE